MRFHEWIDLFEVLMMIFVLCIIMGFGLGIGMKMGLL